jgi:seryl-tRNA synthetase
MDILDELRHEKGAASLLREIQVCSGTIEQVMARSADEIERLRAEVEALKRIIDYAVNELTSMEEANAQTLLADIQHECAALIAAGRGK